MSYGSIELVVFPADKILLTEITDQNIRKITKNAVKIMYTLTKHEWFLQHLTTIICRNNNTIHFISCINIRLQHLVKYSEIISKIPDFKYRINSTIRKSYNNKPAKNIGSMDLSLLVSLSSFFRHDVERLYPYNNDDIIDDDDDDANVIVTDIIDDYIVNDRSISLKFDDMVEMD